MKTVYIKIKPSDTLFFRDGFTFKIGLNNYLQSLDVPYPSVFYGAIFSAILRQGGFTYIKNKINGIKEIENVKAKKVESDKLNSCLKETFKIDDIYLYDEIENEIFIHSPLDIFYNDYMKKIGEYDIENHTFNSPEDEIDKFKRADDSFIKVHDLIKYYAENNMKDIELYPKKYFFNKYIKTGITIDQDSKTAKDKHMYRIDMTEFCDKKFSYLLKCEIDSKKIDLKNDIVRLGGESKLAAFTHTFKNLDVINEIKNFYENTTIKENKLKVILTSPMIIDDKKYNDLKNDQIRIAVTGKPNYVGGFDMAARHKKEMRKAIPSGSVLIVEDDNFIGKKIEKIKIEFLESLQERFRGFGSTIIVPFRRGREK